MREDSGVTTLPFALLVPVKDGRDAKTRLGSIGDDARASLMAAFARDALAAARATDLAEVYVVGDPEALAGLDVPVLPDEGAGSLNRALSRAAASVASADRGVAVMLADLPCLRTADLECALSAAADRGGRVFVADAAGTGTSFLAAAPGWDLEPRFGAGSAAAHLATGASPLVDALPSLRLDVDTTEDLAAALRFGVGTHTARAAADLA
jgi:2-phospho-L-lactate guanylyltransferase